MERSDWTKLEIVEFSTDKAGCEWYEVLKTFSDGSEHRQHVLAAIPCTHPGAQNLRRLHKHTNRIGKAVDDGEGSPYVLQTYECVDCHALVTRRHLRPIAARGEDVSGPGLLRRSER